MNKKTEGSESRPESNNEAELNSSVTAPLSAPSSEGDSKQSNVDEKDPCFRDYRFIMSSFELYETKTRYRVLQIHRTNPKDLVVIEDDVVYSEQEKTRLLKMIEDGNLSVGGLHLVPMCIYGVIGFIRFTQGWYMIFITKRKQVALLGGHYVYHIDNTRLVPIGLQVKVDKNSDEARYIDTFQKIDLTKNFYFSYTYDITNTLQVNMTRPPLNPEENGHNDMFVWNHYLLQSGFKDLNSRSGWILPLIYGFVDQASGSIVVTLIARRSRHFAGARFLKRGVNDKGYVANDVETEQIVAEMTTTSFHSTDRLFGNPRYTSYVQHRGSIPLIWSQDTTNMSPKPPIELNVVDPFFSAAALHFENLFIRYGAPVIVLNLIKQKEKPMRESILGKEFAEAIDYLNQFLAEDKKMKYIAWDMSRASKSHDQDVIGYLEKIAQETMDSTSFFHSGPEPYLNAIKRSPGEKPCRRSSSEQHGVLRTNCIDCLDRTNAAQFLMGKCALGHQLYALGVISSPKIDFDSDVVNIFTEMYHDHGDTIALQYGGSHLVNTMKTYRKIDQWTSHPRDMIESIRRFYANAFSDGDKQDAINLFLGNFVIKPGQPMLWELNSDYHLHNQDPRMKLARRDYRKWCNPAALKSKASEADPKLFEIPTQLRVPIAEPDESDPFQGYWMEYYSQHQLTILDQLFTYNMNGTLKYRPAKIALTARDGKVQLSKAEAQEISPFTIRGPSSGRQTNKVNAEQAQEKQQEESTSELPKEKISAGTIESMVKKSLEPDITSAEHSEYIRYTEQLQSIDKLTVTHGDTSSSSLASYPEYQQYLSYVQRNDLDNNPSALKIQTIDEQVYSTYVDIPRRAGATLIGKEWGGYVRKRYEGYTTYIRTGKYPHSKTAQQPYRSLLSSMHHNAAGSAGSREALHSLK
ncbi:phosphatidylinositol-3,5-bisphosphate 5-phosphatase [Apophysomyces ossiformis]|uniref:Phosphatidylinositol-3,5-bisphosphate 5-phosphatase n=1 Tax=Apophysomyces ossiformis TaxID=679940 RepID=A0A8H7BY70_9FUNG|nr:phosphatidylinositol-3,5-bisphosphate 5-phosphatase [Apophysomyces ossiformis]